MRGQSAVAGSVKGWGAGGSERSLARLAWRTAPVLVLAVLGVVWLLTALFGPGTARAADIWGVQAGGGMPIGRMPDGMPSGFLEPQGFFPNPLTIRVGDTVTWKFAGVHTVTFNSGSPEPPGIMPGPAPGELMLGPGNAPAGPQGPNATYDGSARASSGIPQGPPDTFTYHLTFTSPGMFGYVCVLHPGMRGEIEVLPVGAAVPETPAQAKARGQLTAGVVVGKMRAAAGQVRSANVGRVHTAVAGIGNGFGASALAFLPDDITVRRGDVVVWTMADPFEIHTVTFTSGDKTPPFVDVRPQPQGPPLLVIPASVAGPVGGNTYTGQGLVNSGIATNGNAFILTIDAPPGKYEYHCILHPNMHGMITVAP